ncbi:hypothetical protein C8J57DRAFT_1320658 [Mycena rebaudengoi]|nr:hypothetical protein C8J57DRAFT_1320658 [Mycena rebaudengoi]
MDPIVFYGFAPVPRDPEVLFKDHPTANGDHPKQDPFTVNDFPVPNSPLANQVRAFVQKELDVQTFNHSNRVYVYGSALVKTHFPHWSYDGETYYLACLLHDIGTAEKFLATTKMSFEFKGAIVARDLLLQLGGVEDQADSVCDAIVGQTLQLATILGTAVARHCFFISSLFVHPDNVGIRANLIHPKLIETTTAAFPRNGWSEHFARVIEKELDLKPCNFATDVRGNVAMRPFD